MMVYLVQILSETISDQDYLFLYLAPESCLWKLQVYDNSHRLQGLNSTPGNHHLANTKVRLIIFFAAEDGEALYSQQKQDQEVTLAQIMNSLLPKHT